MATENEGAVATPLSNSQVELVTAGGAKVVIKGFISGGDMEDMQRVLMEGMKFKINPADGTIDQGSQEIPATVSFDRTKKAIELLVISVNGSSDDVYEAVRALPVADYDEVIKKVNDISAPLVPTPSTS